MRIVFTRPDVRLYNMFQVRKLDSFKIDSSVSTAQDLLVTCLQVGNRRTGEDIRQDEKLAISVSQTHWP
jgi:hypothetical protein